MGKIAARFSAKAQKSKSALNTIFTLQENDAYREAMEVFEEEYFEDLQSLKIKNNALLDLVMQNAKIKSTFKVMLHQKLAYLFSKLVVSAPGKEDIPVDFFYFHKNAFHSESVTIAQDQQENIAKNINAHKYANPEVPCFLLPIPGYLDFERALADLPSVALLELKEKLVAFTTYEDWFNLKGPQWLAPERAAEIHNIIYDITEYYMEEPLVPSVFNEAYNLKEIEEYQKEDYLIGYFAIVPVFSLIDKFHPTQAQQFCMSHAEICNSFRVHENIKMAASMAAYEVLNANEENPDESDMDINIYCDTYEINEYSPISIEISSVGTGEMLYKGSLAWIPEIWTPDDMLNFLGDCFIDYFRKYQSGYVTYEEDLCYEDLTSVS